MQEAQGPLGESKKPICSPWPWASFLPGCQFPEGSEWLSRVRFRSPTTNVAMLALRRCLRHGTRGGAAWWPSQGSGLSYGPTGFSTWGCVLLLRLPPDWPNAEA